MVYLLVALFSLMPLAIVAVPAPDQGNCFDMRSLFPESNSTTRCHCTHCHGTGCCIGGVCAKIMSEGQLKPMQTCMTPEYGNHTQWPFLNNCKRTDNGEVCVCNTDFCNKHLTEIPGLASNDSFPSLNASKPNDSFPTLNASTPDFHAASDAAMTSPTLQVALAVGLVMALQLSKTSFSS